METREKPLDMDAILILPSITAADWQKALEAAPKRVRQFCPGIIMLPLGAELIVIELPKGEVEG